MYVYDYTLILTYLDQGKNPKLQVSSYLNNSFSPISSPCGEF